MDVASQLWDEKNSKMMGFGNLPDGTVVVDYINQTV
jgi:hypothetical protein